MAYVLGFFAADGYITVNKRGGQFWCIQITDQGLLHAIRKNLCSNHKISVRRHMRKEKKTQYRLQIGSIEMCDDLRELGFRERKTASLSVPNVPPKYFADFVRGYFDGDGNVWVGLLHKKSKNPNLGLKTMFTSCSIKFLRHLHQGLYSHGLVGGSIYVSKRNYSRLQFSSQDSLKLFDFMYNHISNSKSELQLLRKKRIFEGYIKLKNAAVV
ncbi:MAG: LAGLIDADG family homing endonuclease [Candidatus Vogelbacteria bacterium]